MLRTGIAVPQTRAIAASRESSELAPRPVLRTGREEVTGDQAPQSEAASCHMDEGRQQPSSRGDGNRGP